MKKVLIVGAGGHAQVVADILLSLAARGEPVQPVGYVDDNVSLHGQRRLDLPIWGPIAEWQQIAHDGLIIGIGNNQKRRALFQQLVQEGAELITAVHPTAVIAAHVTIQPGTVIAANVVVNTGTKIGTNVILNTACTVDHHNHIFAHAHIAPGAHLGGDVTVGEGTLIGIGGTIMPQCIIGNWSIIGAGAVVIRSVPDHVTVTGTPGKVVKVQTHE